MKKPTNKKFNRKIKYIADLINHKELAPAESLCKELIKQYPDHPRLLYLLGYIRYFQRRFLEATKLLEHSYKLSADNIECVKILLGSYIDSRQLEKAVMLSRNLLPNLRDQALLMIIYNAFCRTCCWSEAKAIESDVFNAVIKRKPEIKPYLSGFLLFTNTVYNIQPDILYALHRSAEILVESKPIKKSLGTNQNKPQKRIKVAYLSPNFGNHAVSYFMYPILNCHNNELFEIYCYAHISSNDLITETIANAVEHFIDITKLSDLELAKKIRADGIQILVDLAGHTQQSRLQVLCYRAAPVQITYLGYPNTTGFAAVDFRITDHYAESEDGNLYSEKLLFMPQSFLCFGMQPECRQLNRAACRNSSYITFGSFCAPHKLNPVVIKIWCRILQLTPNSRLALKARWNTPTIKNNIVSEFKLHGIAETSLVFLPAVNDYNDHLEQYNLVDIALDTFPYGGTTTTCEALMMGVPVVTLVGKLHAQRVSYSILKNIGFTKTITFSEEEYINTAVKLASHPDVLDSLRTDLPLLLQRSITGQPRKFTRQLEELYLDACLRKGIDISELNNTGVLKTAILTMNNDISIVVPHTLEEPVTYIITEQSDWYEEEICFLREIVKPGMQILDLQAEYGCYALSMAKQIGSTGAILAHDGNKYKCHCLRQSAKLNGFTWLSVTTSDNESVQLQRFLQDGVDFIIAGETNAIVQNILLSIAENCSPLIMARALLDTGLDNSLSNWMDKYDYMPFRLIPSLKILVPLPKDFTPTSWHRQVFFCRPDRAKVLSSKGYLAQREIESIEIPDDLTYWEKSIRSCNYANKLLPIWEQQAQKQLMTAEWETLRNALSAYAVAHDCSITAELRYGCLAATMSLLLNTEELQSSTARLCTVARIATEIRNYPIAIQAAEMVAANIRIDQEFIPNEPFLPMSSSYDQENYQNSLTEWIFAQSIAQIELLKNPTSFWINDSELLKTSDIVQNIGFMNDKLLCRESLIRNRKRINNAEYARGTQNVLENRVLYNPCADQHTRKRRALSLMVFDRLSPDMWRMLRAYFIKAEAKKYENLILAIPSGEDQEKIDLYLKDMCMFEISIDLPVQIITGNSYENQKQFLYDLLQQSNLLHVPKTSSTKVQDMVLEIATELEIQVVWDDEKPYFMPNHLPPIKDFQVTIMLTTYNRVDLLKRAVESILKQTYNDFILVIHDDASTDGTEEYCTNLAQNNTKIRYRRNPTNLGPGVNGADMTCVDTELVMGFTDDDFMLDSAALEKMVDAFHQHPHIGMAFGQCLLGDVHTKKPRSIIPQNYTTNCILDPEQMLLDSIAGNNIYGVGHVFRKSMGGKLIQEYISKLWGKSNIGLEGDYIVGLVECMVAPIAYVHIPSIYYSIWPETISSSQLGGGWSMHIRLRAVALLDNIYHNHFGRTRSENRRIKLMVDIFKQQFKCMQNSMTSEELIERKDELNCYAELIECIKKHKLPNSLLNTTLL